MNRDGLLSALAAFDRREHPLDGRRPAAVAVVVVDADGEPGVVLTRRAAKMRAHARQWALPGGRVDAGESVPDAALRELHEELGMQVGPDCVLGLLDDYPTRSGYRITPVVVWAGDTPPAFAPNPAEVESVHVVGRAALDVDPIFVSIPESTAPVIQLPLLGTRIHAPTAAVVYQFRELALHGRTTRVDHLEQPVFAWR